MTRLAIGGVLGGFAMWFVGFIFWATPLNRIALSATSDEASKALQAALAQHLGPSGTGSYMIPWPMTPAGTSMFGQGPIALVHFNNHGFAVADTSVIVGGLVLAILVTLAAGFAVRGVAAPLGFSARLTLIAVTAAAVTAYTDLGQPIFNHAPWNYYIYLWISDVASWVAAGAVLAWILPRPVAAAPLE